MITHNLNGKVKLKSLQDANGQSNLEVAQLVEVMNRFLANYSVHYQKLRNFHWNVKGPEFFDLHEKFEEQYNFVKTKIDSIAEKIRILGHTPLSRMQDYLDVSELKEAPTDLTSFQMVKEILEDQKVLLYQMNSVLDFAKEYGDNSTEYLVKEIVQQTELYHWMWTAFAEQK